MPQRKDSKATRQLNKEPRKPIARKRTLTQLKNELDKVFSRYIRAKHADSKGVVRCITCEREYLVGDAQAGHFASRRHMATRWDEDNVRPQCYSCNITDQGRQWRFGQAIDREYPGRATEIMEKAMSRTKNSANALQAAIEHYSQELAALEREKNLRWQRSPREKR